MKNWFKVGVLLLLLYLALFTAPVQINLGGSSKGKPENPANETITEAATAVAASAEAGILSSEAGASSGLSEALAKVPEAAKEAYLKRFAKVAMQEQKKFGLPASVMLSMALLHSEAGQRDISAAGNNHFGLLSADKSPKKYERAWDSFRDFSTLVANRVSTKPSKTEAATWLAALTEAGIVGRERGDLEGLIAHFNLQELDAMAAR